MHHDHAEPQSLTQPIQPTLLDNEAVVHSKRWLMDFFPNLRDACIRWSEDDASSMAASVAY